MSLKTLDELRLCCVDGVMGDDAPCRYAHEIIRAEAVKWMKSDIIKYMNGMDTLLVFCDIREEDLEDELE